MTINDYAGKETLPPEMAQRVQSELTTGERLIWVGRARPDAFRRQTIFMAIFGAIFGGVALFMLTKVLEAGGSLFPSLFLLPFLLVGGTMLTAPIWMPYRIRRIIYALTDRRALIWEPGWFLGRYTIRSYAREGLGRMARVDRAGGTGDLVFEEYYTRSTDSDGMSSSTRHQRGFMGIDGVREVEELVRLTLGL
jgi:hypothetical protein